ncbi:hypothetical protein DSM43518_02009 [Mycobacterium marinum]|uniref:DUF7427 family protein n=1 Tax=Mycobacterium marinum TaxID=1781 RepID=UPI000DC739E8|nr:hypothetical protein [Mycobacterium marinum]AXN50922.1 hypothetical protein CCUG20998_03520 [Mycobacterium marinum]RFZ11169.1 hypothetical protein DSM43518_02009 [Mycobacterium marinum]RFZ25480.1 hypothetical protein DSM43519_01666 [Mycobacterium marinum]RFZ28367.1 hypothetical protein DSM44344_01412 [Mycobacterium marinum]RFZ33806.1 hypothetical protein NCTC2275_02652 [Mycobacterium marinum]
MQPRDYACLALAAGVGVWDFLAPPGQTISEACDDYLIRRRAATEVGLLVLYLHVANKLPERVDIVHWMFVGLRRIKATIPPTLRKAQGLLSAGWNV